MHDKYKDVPAKHKRLVEPILTPRFLPTCSKELLKGLAELAAEHNVDVQSHLSESGDEVAFTQSIYGDRTDSELFDEVCCMHASRVLSALTFSPFRMRRSAC